MTPHFHTLSIREARQETQDAVSLSFEVPAELQDEFRYIQGQFLTLRIHLAGQEVRRAYSICSGVEEYRRQGVLRVAIKQVDDGAFSRFAQKLKTGDRIEVMPPEGRFFTALQPQLARHYAAFAAGSGAPNEIELHHGRIDAEKMSALLQLLPASDIDHAFICGPNDMIDCVESCLLAAGMGRQQIHTERFGTPVTKSPAIAQPAGSAGHIDTDTVPLTVILDGKRHALRLPKQGSSVLDVALQAGLDLPYACKGGVCCTCRAKLMDGEVAMEKNYTLEDWEVAQGFVLTCQSHPRSASVTVSFDER